MFALSDFSEGSFAAAMGAMMRVDTDSTAPYLSVPADAREKIYDAVRNWSRWPTGWRRTPSCRMISATQISTTTARAASIGPSAAPRSLRASTPTLRPPTLLADCADKINAACDAGTLPSRTGRRVATSQPISAAYAPSTLAETWNGFWHVLGLRDCAPYETLRPSAPRTTLPPGPATCTAASTAPLTRGRTRPTTARTKRGFCRHAGLDAGMQYFAYGGRALRRAVPAGRAFAAAASKMHGTDRCAVAAAVRHLRHCAAALCMIAFVEVSSFGIGTSTMYLATVHPLLVLYAFAGLLLYGIPRKTDKRRENA